MFKEKIMDNVRNLKIIEDGIIDKAEWDKAKIKVLIVLKESYGGLNIAETGETPDYSYSLPKYIKTWGATGHTFKPVGRWLKALNNCDSDDIDKCIKACAIIDIINVFGENSHTTKYRLKEFFNDKRKNEIESQIIEINPDVIIFGNTYWLFKDAYDLEDLNKDNKYVGKINKKDSIFNGKVVYNGYHPSCVRQRKTGEYNNPEKIAELIKTVFKG